MPALSARDRFIEYMRKAIDAKRLIKLTLGGPDSKKVDLQNVFVRPVKLQEGQRLQFVYRSATQDVTKNVTVEEGLARVNALLEADFRNGHLFATDENVTLEQRKTRSPLLKVERVVSARPPATTHDRVKHRPIEPKQAPWLHGLGVTDAQGAVCKGMEAKFRQINKFVEILQSLVADAGLAAPDANGRARALRVVDMGCGKGYLTFAAYDWLRGHGWPAAEMLGLETRPELVELTNRVAASHGLTGLHFRQGTIAEADVGPMDVLVALHACDTATDDAIARGVKAGASLIVVAPCCHKELRPKLKSPPGLAGALKHGILLERYAEFVTDALRAALLEWAGYEARVFEFVSPEHTARNLMIAAIKKHPAGDAAAGKRVRELAALHGIKRQRLVEALGFALPG